MYLEGNRHMLLLSAFLSTPTTLQKDLLTVQLSTKCIFSMHIIIGNYGKLNFVCILNAIFGVNTN